MSFESARPAWSELWRALRALRHNPLYLRARRDRGWSGKALWVTVLTGLGLLAILTMNSLVPADPYLPNQVALWTVIAATMLNLLVTPALCGLSIATERDSGTGRELLATPVPRTELLAGFLAASLEPLAWANAGCLVALPVLLLFHMMKVGLRDWWVGLAVYAMAGSILMAGHLATIGIATYVTLVRRSTTGAVASAYAAVFAATAAAVAALVGISQAVWALFPPHSSLAVVFILVGWGMVLGGLTGLGLSLLRRSVPRIDGFLSPHEG